MEELKGKQKKLDKNHNGELDAQDFKALRKEEAESIDEGYAKVETKKYSWGTMKTAHHGASFSVPMHPENHKAIHSLKDTQEHKFKDETGRHWTAKRMGDDVHLHSANDGPKTKIKHSDLAESHAPVAPTIDRKYIKGTPEHKAHKEKSKPINGHPTNKMKEEVELDEKLDPSMGAGEYIKDFQKSDAPQFAGKSKEKRRVMGIAAYLGAKRDVKEAVSPVSVKVNHALEEPHEEEWEDTGICPEHNKKDCHQCGKAGMKEQVEEIQEKSDQAKQNKTMKNLMAASKGAKLNRDSGLKLTPGDTGHSNAQQMNKALGRHAMRENEGQKSYKEFMMMLEYESDKSGSYKHTGTYGSEFAKKEREKDEKGFDSENEPAKRGPKMGSKRGPKANLGSSKLHTK
ncbi:hypothetical protein UFOVP240_114 [uncultured Caudovirales phage]|uniref:EF-hand domain-containing protein n=1 Tax=uncultured Caudovirales phage TaxID=2100421 RepID=A0A6J7WTC9_9CAUD|nr:hypothetical protein UFOVP240_114 [uncultured Caudovirales phage]